MCKLQCAHCIMHYCTAAQITFNLDCASFIARQCNAAPVTCNLWCVSCVMWYSSAAVENFFCIVQVITCFNYNSDRRIAFAVRKIYDVVLLCSIGDSHFLLCEIVYYVILQCSRGDMQFALCKLCYALVHCNTEDL